MNKIFPLPLEWEMSYQSSVLGARQHEEETRQFVVHEQISLQQQNFLRNCPYSSTSKESAMASKKKTVVVSTGCSRIKSCFSLSQPHGRPLPQNPCPEASHRHQLLSHSNRENSSAEDYSQRVRQLELELSRIRTQLNKPMSMETKEAQTFRGIEMMRLADGNYLCEIKKNVGLWERLVMQVSEPRIVEGGSNATQVIRTMSSMEMEEFYKVLEPMRMGDIRCCDISKLQNKIVRQGMEDGFMETILLGAIEKIEQLVVEGLKIQMGSSGRVSMNMEKKEKEQSKGSEVLLTVIQLRDPQEKYATVGEMMIGVIEASYSVAEMGERKYCIEGVHVTGIKCESTKNGGEYLMWNTSA